MPKELIITIPGKLPKELSPNFSPLEGNTWAKWRARKEFGRLVYFLAVDARNRWEKVNGEWSAPDVAEIVLRVLWWRRRPDADNLIASLKPAFDALKRAGIIRDDSPKHMKLIGTVIWLKAPAEPQVGIYIQVKEEA